MKTIQQMRFQRSIGTKSQKPDSLDPTGFGDPWWRGKGRSDVCLIRRCDRAVKPGEVLCVPCLVRFKPGRMPRWSHDR